MSASRFSAVRDSRSTRNASPRAVVTSPPRGRSRWGAGTRRPRAASRRARRAPPLPAHPPLPPRPPLGGCRDGSPRPRPGGAASPSSSPRPRIVARRPPDLPTPRVRSRARPVRARPRRSRPRSRARTIATAPSRAAANERARSRRSAPRSGRSARRRPETSTSPRSSARSSASDPPVETRDAPKGATNHPGPQTRVERASTRSSEPSPTTLATGASSPRRASSRDATRSWGASRRKKNVYPRAPGGRPPPPASPRLALAQRVLASIETRARNPTRSRTTGGSCASYSRRSTRRATEGR